jgi:hypothetical protein
MPRRDMMTENNKMPVLCFVTAGRFNPLKQGLDIVELGAIFRNLPDTFSNDNAGKKMFWKRSIEECFKDMYSKYQTNALLEHQKRNGAYKSQAPQYSADTSVHSFQFKIQRKRSSQNSLSLNDKRAAMERATSKPLLKSKAFL